MNSDKTICLSAVQIETANTETNIEIILGNYVCNWEFL